MYKFPRRPECGPETPVSTQQIHLPWPAGSKAGRRGFYNSATLIEHSRTEDTA